MLSRWKLQTVHPKHAPGPVSALPPGATRLFASLLDRSRSNRSCFNRRKTFEDVVPGRQRLHVADRCILSCTHDGYHLGIGPILAD